MYITLPFMYIICLKHKQCDYWLSFKAHKDNISSIGCFITEIFLC